MEVRKSSGELELFDSRRIYDSIIAAADGVGVSLEDYTIDSIVEDVVIYDGMTTMEINRQVSEALMGVNKKVAREYIEKFCDRKQLKTNDDFTRNYIAASNAATGSKYDANANVERKNVVTLGNEIHKGENIRQNRYIMHNKIKALYGKKLADRYLYDLENHILYRHDESGTPGFCYTYGAKETVEVKYGNRHLLVPFDLLWDIVECDAELADAENDVWRKYPDNLLVRERNNTFVKVTALTKKKRHRDLVRVKTAFGEDVIVTDNHPMIVSEHNVNDTVQAIDSIGYPQFKTDDVLQFDGKTQIDCADCPDVIESSSNYCITSSRKWSKRYINVNWDLGYILGFFAGDGNYNNSKDNPSLVFTQKDRETLVKLNEKLFDLTGITGAISYKKDKMTCYTLSTSSTILWWLFSDVFGIQQYSENKTLPINLLEYNEDFAKGLVCGLFDADGTVSGAQLSLRLSSRACILQTTALLRYFGYGVGNTVMSVPFGNNERHIHTNYTVWGVNCSARKSADYLGESVKISKIQSVAYESSLKYKKDGETSIVSCDVIEPSSFLDLNDYIYDITTESRCFSLNNILVHNCVAITMAPFLENGLTTIGGVSIAPTDLKSYCGEFINLVYSVSSQFMGAVATPEFLLYMDYFIRKDYGDDYIYKIWDVVEKNRKSRTLEQVIENCFQQVVHSMNMPAGNRGYQTVFWNVGYFDKPYFDGVFGEFVFPDGTKPVWETLSWLQKKFMKWFNAERTKYVLTFPVETMAMLTDGKDDYADTEYRDWTAHMLSEGHSFFIYTSDSPDSLSSCCRLRNSLKDTDDDHNHTTHQFSMGTASVATGSKCVITIDLNRAVQDAVIGYYKDVLGTDFTKGEKLPDGDLAKHKDGLYDAISTYINELTSRVHKYLTSFNEIAKDFYKAGMETIYSAGYIDLRKQYLTVGVNGLTDAAEFMGLSISPNPDYQEFVNNILETINKCNRADRTRDCMFNTEFIPGENVSFKHYEWDRKAGYYVSPYHIMYSSYFYNPEDPTVSVIDKFRLHGKEYVQWLDGGSALHLNLSEHLTQDQYVALLKLAARYGTNYWTVNVKNTVCEDCGYISKDTLDECPKCHSKNLSYLTRIIGYLKKVKSFAEPRQREEAQRIYTTGITK